jgi:pyroglutamyl-peptidase
MRPLRVLAPIVLLAACAAPDGGAVDEFPVPATSGFDDSLLRDFRQDGKLDEKGHPINALVVEAEELCRGRGQLVAGGFRSDRRSGTVCSGSLPPLPGGDQVVNVRLRALDVDLRSKKDVVRVIVRKSDGDTSVHFTGRSFRANGPWTFIPVMISSYGGESAELIIESAGRGRFEIDYAEIFTNEFPVALGPGSRVLRDNERVTIEAPLRSAPPLVTIDGVDHDLAGLVALGLATRVDTSFRTVYEVAVGALAGGRPGDLEVFVQATSDAQPTARMRVYRQAPPCRWEGDPDGKKVLITGFQPFPVAETHPNVSAVAVESLLPSELVGARVMRLVLPVEYDDGPAIVTDAIERCGPDLVINFGQGGGAIALERTAYNLKDTGRFADNRGRFQAGIEIAEDGDETLSSGLPLPFIKAALERTLPELREVRAYASDSDDPGRYICNNTFYSAVLACQGRATKAGFIHLPYTTEFTDGSRREWGIVVREIVNAAVFEKRR